MVDLTKTKIKDIWNLLRREFPGAILLAGFLLLIAAVTLRPNSYVVGWDNYSSYFAPVTNIFRTLFATWRSYRGLGVPSDSEITDLPRQLFEVMARVVLPETMLDQAYILLCLAAGVIGTYIFVRNVLKNLHSSFKFRELGATIAALFYLCNLNTLAIFYFPIITYITRFATIPIVFLCAWYVVHTLRLRKKYLGIAAFLVLVTSGSYITGTVFITMVMSLGLFFLFQRKFRRAMIFFVFFGLLNSFWILTFLNYTKEKSKLIPQAPTFIEANESQLNKGASFYDPLKQVLLYPNFFETTYQSPTGSTQIPFHPLVTEYGTPLRIMLFIFPICYLAGSLLMLVRFRQYKQLLWVPLLIVLFLLLSMKEYSPVGFIYTFLDQHVPYFGVLFRFGDTKFHPFIAFAGSIAAGVAIIRLGESLRRKRGKIPRLAVLASVGLLSIGIIFPFRRYFSGDLLGFFIYSRIPSAYKAVAEHINADPEYTRVLHVPFDRDAYWKSYGWGSLGSSFFHFMINKPLIDKTFEPASMENAYLHQRLTTLLLDPQLIPTEEGKKERARQMYELLRGASVGYILLDQSVSSYIFEKNIVFGGTYDYADAQTMTDWLIKYHFADEVVNEPMRVYRTDDKGKEESQTYALRLVRIRNARSYVSFEPSGEFVDPGLTTALSQEALPVSTTYIQEDDQPGVIFPFRRDDTAVHIANNALSLSLNNLTLPEGTQILSPENQQDQSRLVAVSIQRVSTGYRLIIEKEPFPSINGQAYRVPLAVYDLPQQVVAAPMSPTTPGVVLADGGETESYASPFRLQVGKIILPLRLPSAFQQQVTIGHVILHKEETNLQLYVYKGMQAVDLKNIQPTANPNCFNDAMQPYSFTTTLGSEGVTLESKNGSSCWWTGLNPFLHPGDYGEVETEISGESADLDPQSIPTYPITKKPNLRREVISQPKPNSMRFCLTIGMGGDCLNTHQYYNVAGDTTVRIPLNTPIPLTTEFVVIFTNRPIGYQQQSVTIHQANVLQFTPVWGNSIPQLDLVYPPVTVEEGTKNLVLSTPIPSSPDGVSVDLRKEGWYVSNRACEHTPGYRTIRLINGNFVSYVEDCYNQFFQELPYRSDAFMMWHIAYDLYSGKFPKFIISDKLIRPVDQYVSIDQGYPDIPGFKSLQSRMGLSQEQYRQILSNFQTIDASIYLPPAPEREDTRRKQYALLEHSESEGALGVSQYNLVELPVEWRNLSIVPPDVKKDFTLPVSVATNRILPSLLKVKVGWNGAGEYLLRMQEAYDRQWVIVGGGVSVAGHGRCDGFANCFRISVPDGREQSTFYVLYVPEILNVLGIALTVLTVGMIPLFFRLYRKHSST